MYTGALLSGVSPDNCNLVDYGVVGIEVQIMVGHFRVILL